MKANVTAARYLSCLVFSAGLSQTTQLSVTTMTAIQTLSECDGGRSECDDGRSECDGWSECDDGGASVMVGGASVMVGGV